MKMTNTLKDLLGPVIALSLTLTALTMAAQSRMPEIKFKPLQKKEAADTFGFEERPYFILIEQSEKALAENDYHSAGLRLVEAMAIEPDNPLNVALLSNLGMIYFYNEQDTLALQTLDRAVERSPRLVGARENRARVLMSMNRDADAYADYEAIIDIDSTHCDARFFHAMMSLYTGQLQKAQKDIAVLRGIVPLWSKTMLADATMNAMTGNNHEAVSLYRRLIERERMPEYYAALAGCLIAVDNLHDASSTIAEGLKHFGNDPELYYYRALLNKKRFLNDDAMRDARRAIELGADPRKVNDIFAGDQKR